MKELEKYKDKFLENIEYNCNLYKLIGSGTSESPMWFQLQAKDFDEDRAVLFFRSSQRNISFEIQLDEEDRWMQYEDFNNLYKYFRDLKYSYIKENHPKIYNEIK
jgi:hypothetical protein